MFPATTGRSGNVALISFILFMILLQNLIHFILVV
jgi:hypothetical protein